MTQRNMTFYDPKRKRGEAAGVADSHKELGPSDNKSALVHVKGDFFIG